MSAKKSLPRGALARAEKVLAALQARYPRPATHLEADNAWELLVATVLAAQCTDARVNTVTPELFRRWPGPAELALATQEELESVIRSTGFYHSKARNLLGAAQRPARRPMWCCSAPSASTRAWPWIPTSNVSAIVWASPPIPIPWTSNRI